MSSTSRAEKCSMRPSPLLRPITPLPTPDATERDRHLLDRVGITLVVALVAAYKSLLSPLFTGSCRFEPSCSDYMTQAVNTHGAARGTWLGVRRLAKCHPFGRSGADPCPPAVRTERRRRRT
jgi:putative membrane protein insertion efficiency factor